MQTINFFDQETDLQQLTGLTHEQLGEQGFDLDDWDWGFAAEEDYVEEYPDEFGGTSFQIKYDIPSYIYSILSYMENYCCGFRRVKYDNKFYYLLYHS